jgi:hypothetical protein
VSQSDAPGGTPESNHGTVSTRFAVAVPSMSTQRTPVSYHFPWDRLVCGVQRGYGIAGIGGGGSALWLEPRNRVAPHYWWSRHTHTQIRTVFPNRITRSYYGAGNNDSQSGQQHHWQGVPIYKLHGGVLHQKQVSHLPRVRQRGAKISNTLRPSWSTI